MNATVTFKGEPVTLIGNPVEIGRYGPDFIVRDHHFTPVAFSSLQHRPRLLASVVCVDTEVCSEQIRQLGEKFTDKLEVMVISMDLPFTQQRWLEENGLKSIQAFSDHCDAAFGTAYGLLIKDWRLLARSVHMLDSDNVVRYTQVVPEITEGPDYGPIEEAAQRVV